MSKLFRDCFLCFKAKNVGDASYPAYACAGGTKSKNQQGFLTQKREKGSRNSYSIIVTGYLVSLCIINSTYMKFQELEKQILKLTFFAVHLIETFKSKFYDCHYGCGRFYRQLFGQKND